MNARRNAATVRFAPGVFAAAALALVAGCASESRQQLADIRSDPTPELVTMTQRQDDVDNELTMQFNTDLRGLKRDLGVLLNLQGASRLSPYPVR